MYYLTLDNKNVFSEAFCPKGISVSQFVSLWLSILLVETEEISNHYFLLNFKFLLFQQYTLNSSMVTACVLSVNKLVNVMMNSNIKVDAIQTCIFKFKNC